MLLRSFCIGYIWSLKASRSANHRVRCLTGYPTADIGIGYDQSSSSRCKAIKEAALLPTVPRLTTYLLNQVSSVPTPEGMHHTIPLGAGGRGNDGRRHSEHHRVLHRLLVKNRDRDWGVARKLRS